MSYDKQKPFHELLVSRLFHSWIGLNRRFSTSGLGTGCGMDTGVGTTKRTEHTTQNKCLANGSLTRGVGVRNLCVYCAVSTLGGVRRRRLVVLTGGGGGQKNTKSMRTPALNKTRGADNYVLQQSRTTLTLGTTSHWLVPHHRLNQLYLN